MYRADIAFNVDDAKRLYEYAQNQKRQVIHRDLLYLDQPQHTPAPTRAAMLASPRDCLYFGQIPVFVLSAADRCNIFFFHRMPHLPSFFVIIIVLPSLLVNAPCVTSMRLIGEAL